jgi:lysophospholipase L1-like esterase
MSAERDRLSERAKRWIVAGLTVAVVAAVLAAAEIAVRVRQTLKYGAAATVEQQYTVDERIGLRVPLANLDTGRIRTNSRGFRGPEIAMPKPPGTVRIAFLGASTTWCAEVSGDDKVWAHLVTEDLRRALPGTRFDFVNGGVPGYTVKSSLKNLEHRVAPLQPDVIVIYHATNDLSGELRELAAAKGVIRSARVEPQSWLSEYSLLWNLAEKNWRVMRAQRQAEANAGRLVVEPDTLGEPFRRDLTALVRAAQKQARVVAVATFATQLRPQQTAEEQLRASASALYYVPFMTPAGLIAAYDRYNRVIREVAAATGAIPIDGEDTIPGDPAHFNDTVHFTDAGSARMAERVASALVPALKARGTGG